MILKSHFCASVDHERVFDRILLYANTQKAMAAISKLPDFLRKPLLKAGMTAMANPPAAIKRAALLTLPLNIAVLMLPNLIKFGLLLYTKSYDNVSPRGKKQTDLIAQNRFGAMVQRCQAAHRNSIQCFPYAFTLSDSSSMHNATAVCTTYCVCVCVCVCV